jgi:uncharacterized membrane protein
VVRRDILVLAAICIVAVLGALSTIVDATPTPLTAVLGVLFVFVCPGLALTLAARGGSATDGLEQALFTLGLSLVTVILGSLLLTWAGIPMSATPWSILLAAVTIGASLVALLRRRSPATAVVAAPRQLRPNRTWLLWGLSGAIVAAALVVARMPAPPTSVEGYTQLWLLPAADAEPTQVTLGVRSMELTDTEYRLDLAAEGATVQQWPSLHLAPGQSWQASVDVSALGPNADRLVATLYRADDGDQAYRRVILRGNEVARAS